MTIDFANILEKLCSQNTRNSVSFHQPFAPFGVNYKIPRFYVLKRLDSLHCPLFWLSETCL